MTVFDFMGNHPIVTVILAALACGLARGLMRWIAVMTHGYPPVWCDSEGRFKEKE
ncbi:hypothetical protein NAD41_002370 [Salmonella enterica]|nr:hypothetical protein [Salmonella enterica]EKK6596338.1 hypothetical protein [Salmonella enterica]